MARRHPRDGDLWFNADEADRVVEFWESALVHTEGLWAGQPFILRDWQREEMIRPLFGWQRYDEQWEMWVRRYSIGSFWLPRGNGKTPIAAGIIIVGLVADGERGAQNYGAAEDRDQAGVVFRDVQLMVKHSPILSPDVNDRLTILESRKRIVDRESDSFYWALPRDELGEGAQGFKPHVWVVDEYHVQKSKSLINALRKGMGKRTQSLGITISTAGADEKTPAAEDYAYAKKVRDGKIEDPDWFVYIAEAGIKDDPYDEATWRKANPALGDFLSIHTVRQEAREAKQKPSEENDFLRFRLDLWVKDVSVVIPSETWDASAGPHLLTAVEADMAGRMCWGGLDLASTRDITALVWDFPQEDEGHVGVFRFWIPEERIPDLDKRTDGDASVWVREGWLQTTPGNRTDYDAIQAQIVADGGTFEIQELGYDPWNIGNLVSDLADAPFEMVEIRQTFEQVAEPTKAWEWLIFAGAYRHCGHPVMAWMVGNVVPQFDRNGNWKIDKKNSTDKVDGPVAGVMALKLARQGRTRGRAKRAAGF